MKYQLFSILLLIGVMFTIPVKAVPGPAAGNCDEYVHHASIALTNVITAGDFEAWGGVGCEGPRTDHSVVFFNGQASGPALAGLFLGTVTQDWGVDTGQIPGGAIGCTVGTPPVPHTAANTQSGLFTVTLIPITMTSNECTVPIRYHLSLAVAAVEVFNWFATFTVHLAVDEPPLTYLCAATNANPNAFDYDTTTCNPPAINAALTGQLAQLNYQCMASDTTPNAFNPATNTCQPLAILEYQCHASLSTPNGFNPNTDTCNTQANLNYQCHASRTTVNAFNPNTDTCNTQTNLNFQCNASRGTPNAFNPNTDICAELTTFNLQCNAPVLAPGSYNPNTEICNDPQYNNLNYLCAATAAVPNSFNPATTTCNALAINVVNSGGQNIAITSWPSLLATLSGGVTITDDANGWIIHQDPLSGTVNVVNSGGQTISVSSWPALIATLSGDINVHQDEACGAVVHCKVDMTCLSGTCQSMVQNATVINNGTTSNNLILGILPYNLLLVAVAFFAIAGEAKKDLLYWIMCLILSIVLIFVRPATSVVPVEFFVGWIFIVLYQIIVLFAANRSLLTPAED